MDLTEAIRIARKTLAEHFDLKLRDTPKGGRMFGVGTDEATEAADAYNTLAAFHPKAERVK